MMIMNTTKQNDIKLSPQEIAQKAYQLWEQDGHKAGQDMRYWLQAEKELRAACYATNGKNPQIRIVGTTPWSSAAAKESHARAY